ncbi:MAG: hypothetical protein KDA37_16425 [Planctomycetales bacterium]|nr:hypothetical protein [Planctomycetales bacterium]
MRRRDGERLIRNPERALWPEVLRLAMNDALHRLPADAVTRDMRKAERAKTIGWLTTLSRDLELVCDMAGVEKQSLIESFANR